MTDKEKREIKDGVISIFKRFNILDHTATIGGLKDDILRYIDSLQEELNITGISSKYPTGKLKECIDRVKKAKLNAMLDESLSKETKESWNERLGKEEPSITEIVDKHFWEMLGEEPVSEELEEASEQLAENARKYKAETSSPFFSQTDYKQGVMDGAKWQKTKDKESIETAIHHAYHNGRLEMKEQMMKDAVDGKVEGSADPDSMWVMQDGWFSSKERGLVAGDKVKLVIIKKD